MLICNGQMRMVVLGWSRDLLSLVRAWRVGICSNGCVDGEERKGWSLLGAPSLTMVMCNDQMRIIVLGCQRGLSHGVPEGFESWVCVRDGMCSNGRGG